MSLCLSYTESNLCGVSVTIILSLQLPVVRVSDHFAPAVELCSSHNINVSFVTWLMNALSNSSGHGALRDLLDALTQGLDVHAVHSCVENILSHKLTQSQTKALC